MLVVGGVYGERCAEPEIDELAGSGLRAAAALAGLVPDIRLQAAVAATEATAAEFIAKSHQVNAAFATRSEPVSWSYFTPLSAPTLNGSGSSLTEPIDVEDDAVLAFGLIEADPVAVGEPVRIRGRRIAFDPQKPRDLGIADTPRMEAEEVLLILNEDETRALGNNRDSREAARALLDFNGLNVAAVVIKRGPRGAVVVDRTHEPQVVSPRWTPQVYPIGSGDVFAAVAGWAWADQGADPVEAARMGSAAAAYWCDTQETPVTSEAINDSPYPAVGVDATAKVYLAGPFFNLAQRWLIDLVDHKLRPYRFSPFHHVGVGGLEVAQQDIDGLLECTSMLALLDGSDPGTIFEAGYATRLQQPVVCFAEHLDDEGFKMLAGTGAEITSDLSTAVYHAIWAAMDPEQWTAKFRPR